MLSSCSSTLVPGGVWVAVLGWLIASFSQAYVFIEYNGSVSVKVICYVMVVYVRISWSCLWDCVNERMLAMLWKDGYKSARLYCFGNEGKCCVTSSGQECNVENRNTSCVQQ